MPISIHSISSPSIRKKISSFKKSYPFLKIDIIEKEFIQRLSSSMSCDISGLHFTDISNISLLPLNPLSDDIVHINNTLIVHSNITPFWNEFHSIIKTTADLSHLADDHLSKLTIIYKSFINQPKIAKLNRAHVDFSYIINRSETQPARITNFYSNSIKDIHIPIEIDYSQFIHKKPFFSESSIKRKIHLLKKRSKQKGFSCDLTFSNCKHLFAITHCQLTGLPLCKSSSLDESPLSFSIDRINRFEGYNLSNIIIIAKEANTIKASLEQHNYTESVSNLHYILYKTKNIMLQRYSNFSNLVTPISVDDIIKLYSSKPNNFKKFLLT